MNTSGSLSYSDFFAYSSEPEIQSLGEGWIKRLNNLPTIQQNTWILIDEALRRTDGNQAKAAILLGITPQALGRRLKDRA